MFTGIISHIGKLKERRGSSYIFTTSSLFYKKLADGTSIAVNGVCLTVVDKGAANSFTVEIMPETVSRTMLDKLKKADLVNLELPVTPYNLLSGHITYGHIDGMSKLTKIIKRDNSRILKFSIFKSFSKYIVAKGSIAINGISLTVIEAAEEYFTVGIIPYTFANTNLHESNTGDLVNIEVDILAKYVEKLLQNE